MENPSAGNGQSGPAGPGPGGSGNDPVRPIQPAFPPRPNLHIEPHPDVTPRFLLGELPATGSGRRYDTQAPYRRRVRRHYDGY
jgi:hypothetical protein